MKVSWVLAIGNIKFPRMKRNEGFYLFFFEKNKNKKERGPTSGRENGRRGAVYGGGRRFRL